jgi:6-phosphogluconolactonase
MTGPRIVRVADATAGAARAAEAIAEALADAVAERGRADWATTGGSTVVAIYQALMAPDVRDRIAWDLVHTWWGDERFVPQDHPLSNAGLFEDVMLEAGAWESVHSDDPRTLIRIPAENVHPFHTGETIGYGGSADDCARDMAHELRGAELPDAGGWPAFDLVLLGVGGDGHILSVFPGSKAFDATDLALGIPAPTHIEPHVPRVTLHPSIVSAARRVVVVSNGASKAATLGQVFSDPVDPRRLPAQLARRDGATWILDEAAAANLPR